MTRFVAHYNESTDYWEIHRVGTGGNFGKLVGHDKYNTYTDCVEKIAKLEQKEATLRGCYS